MVGVTQRSKSDRALRLVTDWCNGGSRDWAVAVPLTDIASGDHSGKEHHSNQRPEGVTEVLQGLCSADRTDQRELDELTVETEQGSSEPSRVRKTVPEDVTSYADKRRQEGDPGPGSAVG